MANPISGAASGAAAGSTFGPVGGLIGGALGGLGALFGGNAAADAKREALANYLATIQSQQVANPDQYVADYQKLSPQQLQQYQAQQESNINEGPSALNNIHLDPALQEAQQNALAKMQQIGNEGLSVSDLAARNQILNATGVKEKGAQDAILQNMQQRGMGGSGAELAARLASTQGDYQNAAQQGEQLAAQRDQRAKEAVLQSGQMAGTMQGADYARQQNLANSQDLINKFNTQNALGVQQQNVANKQNASNSNVGQANQTLVNNQNLTNTQANQKVAGTLGQIQGQNAIKQAVGQGQLQQGGINAEQATNLGKAAGTLGSGVGDFLSKYI